MKDLHKKLVIVGGGSAGMASAISAFDNGIKDILIIEKSYLLGGILNQCIQTGFGTVIYKEDLTGPEFMTRFSDEIEKRNIQALLNTNVLSIEDDKTLIVSNGIDGVFKIKAEAIIIATGCYEKNAGAISLPGDRPNGIITAGQAKLYLTKYAHLVGKKIFILGSGDIGLVMARQLVLQGADVIGVAEILPFSPAYKKNIVTCLQDFNIPLYLSTTVYKVVGKDNIEKIILAKVDENLNYIEGSQFEVYPDTLLLSVGLLPDVGLLHNLDVKYSKTRGPIVNEWNETNIKGLFCTGNSLHVHDLVDNVVQEGYLTGIGASKYLNNQLIRENSIELIEGDNILYVVPQKISFSNLDDIVIKYRSKKPFYDKYIYIKHNEKVIYKEFKKILFPSEMETIFLKRSLIKNLDGQLKISIGD